MSEINLEAYLGTHLKLQEAIAGLTKEQLLRKEEENKWSVTEVLAHLADHNIVVSFRIRDILAGTKAKLPAFDQDEWVRGQRANAGEAADILVAYQALLHYNGLLFRRLEEEDFDKTGVNARGENVRIRDIIKGFTKHVETHLAQIERIKQKVLA